MATESWFPLLEFSVMETHIAVRRREDGAARVLGLYGSWDILTMLAPRKIKREKSEVNILYWVALSSKASAPRQGGNPSLRSRTIARELPPISYLPTCKEVLSEASHRARLKPDRHCKATSTRTPHMRRGTAWEP